MIIEKSWILFFLGTLAYFFYKYLNRKNKQLKGDFRFWIIDNWQELVFAFVFDFAVMMILMDPGTIFDLSNVTWFPSWLILPAKLTGSFIIGFGGGVSAYNMVKKKIRYEFSKVV